MIKRKEHHVGEIFRYDDETFQCVRSDKSEGVRCLNCEASYLLCVASMCHRKERSDKRNVRFIRVTEPKEHMLFRASDGAMYVLKDKSGMNEYAKLGCMCFDSPELTCYNIFREAFGKEFYSTLHWFPAEENKAQNQEKEEEKKMENQKRHIELAVVKVEGDHVTFRIAEQTHRGKNFSQDGAFFKAKNGLWLASADKESFKCENVIFVRSDNKKFDDANIACTVYDFANVMEAVAEYNETDGKGYEKKFPEEGDTFYCITSAMTVSLGEFGSSQDGYEFKMRDAGNCFQTFEEAKAALERVKKALKGEYK